MALLHLKKKKKEKKGFFFFKMFNHKITNYLSIKKKKKKDYKQIGNQIMNQYIKERPFFLLHKLIY